MNEDASIESELRASISREVVLHREGSRWLVFTPFRFDDGDSFVIALHKDQNRWYFSDEGHTLMHLSYRIDEAMLQKGNRAEIISGTLSPFDVKNKRGVLVKDVEDDDFGNALYSFIQAIVKVSDVSMLSRDRVRSTFLEDVDNFLREVVGTGLVKDWIDKKYDSEARYRVPYAIETVRNPLWVFPIQSDSTVQDATIVMLKHESWGTAFEGVGIFEQQSTISRDRLARFSDVCGKQFSSLEGNRDRIKDYLQREMS
ncbi:MAG: DUF1828 domain-containing protein ['Candidatus Kapabacteria' thiocyanatum]|uniref:DUF1828 domain-containing protein n=1 Tax=Candidatus Kapaibacterium thiocyanatum TaxID=1895771 RepID=A0A1M3L3Q9_9BACT|nr:DUF1828 domain-containing protein ['Candidatus Kapabacteria' thiocyanatum]OJX59987.1 MAG: hypothetical protein BGO89_08330 ['Candidatus Kapabacteria' thiocyanatum]